MGRFTRREFLKSSAGLTTGAAVVGAAAVARSGASPNDRVRVGVCGVQGRGWAHIRALHQLAYENVEIAALCDVHEGFLDEAARRYKNLSGREVARYNDMRRMIDDKSIHGVTFATPNHWHALGTIWACQADKDVYVEKPGTQNFAEGRKVIEAARTYKRMVQHGTQCRSSDNIREGMARLKEGVIGRVYMARIVNYKLRAKSPGRHEPQPVPKGFNWDMWLGPGPKIPFSHFHWQRYNWRWDFGVGDIGNQGVHQLDIVRWGLGMNTHPTKIQAMGGNLFHPDSDCECPNTMVVAYRYGDGNVLVTCETRDGYTNAEAGMGIEYPFVDHRNVVGVIFIGTKGYMIIPDYSSYHTFLGAQRERGPSKSVEGNPMMDTDHFRNWVQAIRSRNSADLNADIAEGHLSAALVHLANIAYRTGRTVDFDPKKERFPNDAEANALLARRNRREPYVIPDRV